MKKIVLAVFAIGALMFTSCSKKQIRVERTTTINTPAETVYKHVSCLKNWKAWSPWAKMDKSITADKNYSGPDCGVGSTVAWDSEHKKVGKGKQTLVEAVPNSHLRFDLDFFDKGTGIGHWNFEEVNGATNITWAMETEVPTFVTWMVDFEEEIGPMFEEGLAGLKTTVEEIPVETVPIKMEVDSLATVALKVAEGVLEEIKN